jgi:probable addiction module antidote protein
MDNQLLVGSLKDQEEACNYLNDMLKYFDEPDFIFALYNVVIAQGGLNQLAEKTGLGRESLYKTLTPHTDPRFNTICTIIKALGYEIQFLPVKKSFLPCEQKASYVRLNSLAQVYPELAKQWHMMRNGRLTPNDVTAESRKFVWWICPKNQSHEWQASCKSRLRTNCPFCESPTKTQETL